MVRQRVINQNTEAEQKSLLNSLTSSRQKRFDVTSRIIVVSLSFSSVSGAARRVGVEGKTLWCFQRLSVGSQRQWSVNVLEPKTAPKTSKRPDHLTRSRFRLFQEINKVYLIFKENTLGYLKLGEEVYFWCH